MLAISKEVNVANQLRLRTDARDARTRAKSAQRAVRLRRQKSLRRWRDCVLKHKSSRDSDRIDQPRSRHVPSILASDINRLGLSPWASQLSRILLTLDGFLCGLSLSS